MFGQYAFHRKASTTFDPATLSLSGWWRANYTGSPWNGVASAGASSGRNLSEATNPPATGAAQNSLTPADFDGTNDVLNIATDITSFATTTASTLIVLFRADTSAAPTGSIYDDAAMFTDANADYGMTFTSSGVTVFAYDGAYQSRTAACATGAYHLAMLRHNGTNLGLTLDSAAESTVACGTLAVLTGNISLGRGYLGTKFFDGRILEVLVSTTALTNTDYTNIKSYVNSRYALAL